MSRLSTKQRRSRRRRREAQKPTRLGWAGHLVATRPGSAPFAGLRYWLDHPGEGYRGWEALAPPQAFTEKVLQDAFEKLKAEQDRADREFREWYWGPRRA